MAFARVIGAGCFTGAIRGRPGRFKQADGGTILLDSIGSMPLSGQAKLSACAGTRI
ncbi:MAG: sigma 54-interacting transcriptional regulator [Gammaproteobacteria bacterium]